MCLCESYAEQRHQQGPEEELVGIGDQEQRRKERYAVESLDEVRYPEAVVEPAESGSSREGDLAVPGPVPGQFSVSIACQGVTRSPTSGVGLARAGFIPYGTFARFPTPSTAEPGISVDAVSRPAPLTVGGIRAQNAGEGNRTPELLRETLLRRSPLAAWLPPRRSAWSPLR